MQHERPFTPATGNAGCPLVDRYGRVADYLRISVTDRCDLRCTYCMAEHMTFLPRKDVLSFEELYRLCRFFIRRGVRKIRVTGGEPLVRKGVLSFFAMLSKHLGSGELDEVTLTTNGAQLDRHAAALYDCGVRRVNVSLDTLNTERYAALTRWGRLEKVLAGIDAALKAGLKVKINAVAMKGPFETEVDDLIRFAHGRGMDLTLIEEMPLGEARHDRRETNLSLVTLRQTLASRWTLTSLSDSTGGPARYLRITETGGRLGFITPLSCDFCAACNRIRLSCTGDLFTCMGDEGRMSLRGALRSGETDEAIEALVSRAIAAKPKGHNFRISARSVEGIDRHMSVLGG
jgi:GTP 3',8-cyclase